MRPLAVLLLAATPALADPPHVTAPLIGLPAQPPTGVLAVSPDGEWAALYQTPAFGRGAPPHVIQFWDIKTGTLRAAAEVEADSMYFGAVASPDGRKLLARPTRKQDGAAVVIDAATGRQFTVPGVTNVPLGFTADSAGLFVYEAAQQGKEAVVAVRAIPDGKRVREIRLPNFGWLTIAPDGKVAHHKSNGNAHEVWDFEAGKRLSTLTVEGKEETYNQNLLGFAGGAKKVVTHSFNTHLWVFDAATGKRERVIPMPTHGHGNGCQLQGLADDLSCVSATTDKGEAAVFEPGKVAWRFTFPPVVPGESTLIVLTPDGKHVLRSNTTYGTDVYDAKTGKHTHTLRPDTQQVRALAFSADGKSLVVGTANKPFNDTTNPADPAAGQVRVWDAATGELRKAHAGIDPQVCQVFPSPDGSRAVVVAGKVRPDYYGWTPQRAALLDLATGKELRTIAGPKDQFYGFVASADGRRLAAVTTEDRKKGEFNAVFVTGTRVWNVPTGEKLSDLSAVADTRILSLAPDGERVLALKYKGGVESWGVEGDKSRLIWAPPPQPKDGRRPFMPVALPRGDEFVALLGPGTNLPGDVCWYAAGRQITFGKVPNAPGPLAASADGKRVAAGEQTPYPVPTRAFVWKLPDPPPPFDEKAIKNGVIPPEEFPVEPVVLHGHTGPVNALAFSPDGRTLATGGGDCAVRVWDATTGRLKATLWTPPAAKPGDAPTDWVAFTPEGFCAGTDRGLAFLRVSDAVGVLGFRVPVGRSRTVTADDPLFNPAKVKESLGAK